MTTTKNYPGGVIAPYAGYNWPCLEDVGASGMIADVAACRAAGVPYRMGGKAPQLGCAPAKLLGGIDCSGYVRRLLYQFCGFTLPDGSVQQHDRVTDLGFKQSDIEAGKLADGGLRIAFLPPIGGEAGHVVLIYNGQTLESHGGVGPDRRAWTGEGWQGRCSVYVLRPPVPPAKK